MKLHLTTKNLRPAIEKATDEPVGEAKKATAMIFIRRHILTFCKLSILLMRIHVHYGVALADRFDHQNDIFLHEARHEWQHLSFRGFKSANEYNSEVCQI